MTDEDNERTYDTTDGKATNKDHSKVTESVTSTTSPRADGSHTTVTERVVTFE